MMIMSWLSIIGWLFTAVAVGAGLRKRYTVCWALMGTALVFHTAALLLLKAGVDR